ncbi:CvpA family protein [Alkalibacillus salilacus]|uniref:Membrane protein required for colicin V production n=1 Tax=Alkalibacillus salilacus TaxID=284582 RepID=A0ABT9VDG3_9BACI|nr:CvpA family protein [Alkalibacillus salilacus]MDQ0158880.1 putative membrane protein required for colicin V production [Alkalibacillus salilacus]
MIDLILIIIFILGFLIGLKRGFVLQILHLTGFMVAFIVAYLYYRDLAGMLELWVPNPEADEGHFWAEALSVNGISDAFYNSVAFILIFIIVKILMQVLANMLDFVANMPILNSVNNLLGAILGFIETYIIIFILLFGISLLSVDFVQSIIQDSIIASFMIEHTPVLTEALKNAWFEQDA